MLTDDELKRVLKLYTLGPTTRYAGFKDAEAADAFWARPDVKAELERLNLEHQDEGIAISRAVPAQ